VTVARERLNLRLQLMQQKKVDEAIAIFSATSRSIRSLERHHNWRGLRHRGDKPAPSANYTRAL
jgi:hypothetical protein